MGQRQLSLKGGSPIWRGITRLSSVDGGARHFTKLENCYISSDGSEIRHFPGYGTFLDLTDINNSQGFSQYQIDTLRPLARPSPGSSSAKFQQDNRSLVGTPDAQQTHYSRSKPAHVYAFEQINNEIVLIGESRFREDPVYPSPYTSPNDVLTVSSVDVTVSGTFSITLNAAVGGTGYSYASTRPINYLWPGQSVFVDGVTVADATLQAELDARVNGKIHRVDGGYVAGSAIVSLTTTTALGTQTEAATAGELHHVRYARSGKGAYDPSTPNSPYVPDYHSRPDDPDALTVWRVREPVNPYDSDKQNNYECTRSEVCNRQRDWGDGIATTTGPFAEGTIIEGSPDVAPTPSMKLGISRREQRKLPYRPHVECAADRIILAVPQYGCMFQIPMRAPIIGTDYTTPFNDTYDGVSAIANDIYDRPRSLGIPKPRLVESGRTTPQPSPMWDYWSTPADVSGYSSSIWVSGSPNVPLAGIGSSPNLGLDAGTYKVAISFEDPGTGEEGLASETMEVEITAGTFPQTIFINYVHPGYHFPEAAAWKVNVYIAPPDEEALAFYGQWDLQRFPRSSPFGNTSGGDESALYGLPPRTPRDPDALVVRFALPLPNASPRGTISSYLDPTRLAPQSATMPRGASACKMIRGVLFAGGALGNAGPDLQLWKAKASSRWVLGDDRFSPDNQMWIRAHSVWETSSTGSGIAFGYSSPGTDGDLRDTTLGIAGRSFPDAYQGIEFINNSGLFPGRDSYKIVDRVLNRIAYGERDWGSPNHQRWRNAERLRLLRSAFNRNTTAGSTESTPNLSSYGDPIYYVMPRGQLQVGDPGAPHRSSRAFIKIVDANKGDDITAIGQVGGAAVVCTRKETYSYSWYVNPSASQPSLLSNEFGCIASNSMVEFDGGLAWLSERGPVAMGQGLQYVGANVGEDFYSNERRYLRDSRGMMRHSWGAHDAARGLILWGLLTREATHKVTDENTSWAPLDALNVDYAAYQQPADYGDQLLSRFPCDEVLIWNYRVNAFSTWRPPAGLEVYWMRPIRDANGAVRMAFLAADQRIYVLNDEWGDANGVFGSGMVYPTTAAGTKSTTMTLATSASFADGDTLTAGGQGRNWVPFIKPGLLVELLDDRGNIVAETTVASVTTTGSSSNATFELTAAQSWTEGQSVRIGARQRATIVTNYMGSAGDKMSVSGVSMRYRLFPHGTENRSANVRVVGYKSDDGTYDGADARVVAFTREGEWEELGYAKANSTMPAEIEQLGRRKTFSEGRADAEEMAFKIELTGERQTRIQDIMLEVDV